MARSMPARAAFTAADLATLKSIFPLGRRHRGPGTDLFAVSCRDAGVPWLFVARQKDGRYVSIDPVEGRALRGRRSQIWPWGSLTDGFDPLGSVETEPAVLAMNRPPARKRVAPPDECLPSSRVPTGRSNKSRRKARRLLAPKDGSSSLTCHLRAQEPINYM